MHVHDDHDTLATPRVERTLTGARRSAVPLANVLGRPAGTTARRGWLRTPRVRVVAGVVACAAAAAATVGGLTSLFDTPPAERAAPPLWLGDLPPSDPIVPVGAQEAAPGAGASVPAASPELIDDPTAGTVASFAGQSAAAGASSPATAASTAPSTAATGGASPTPTTSGRTAGTPAPAVPAAAATSPTPTSGPAPGSAPATPVPSPAPAPATTAAAPPAAAPATVPPSTTPTSASTVPPPAASATAVDATVNARGGSIRVRCVGEAVSLLGVTAAGGYQYDVEHAGPQRVEVDLWNDDLDSEIRVECKGGSPVPQVVEDD